MTAALDIAPPIPSDRCSEHKKKFGFFCQTCEQFLCADCLFDQVINQNDNERKHYKHQIIKIEDLAKSQKSKLINEMNRINPMCDAIERHIKELNSYSQSIKDKKELLITEMVNQFKTLERIVEEQFLQVESEILSDADIIEQKQESIHALIDEADIILFSNDPKMYPNASLLIQKLEKFDIPDFQGVPKKFSYNSSNELFPEFKSKEIKIPEFWKLVKKFSSNRKNDVSYIFSAEIKMFHNFWKVKFYPNGNGISAEKNLSIYVVLSNGNSRPITYTYQIEIMNHISNETCSINRFKKSFSSVFLLGDTWGWSKFVQLEDIHENNLVFPDGSLRIKFSIRPETYYQSSLQSKSKYEELRFTYRMLKEEATKKKRID